jgi:hypothetical protein
MSRPSSLVIACKDDELYEQAYPNETDYPPIALDYTSVGKLIAERDAGILPPSLRNLPAVLVFSSRENRFYMVPLAPAYRIKSSCRTFGTPDEVCRFVGPDNMISDLPSSLVSVTCGSKVYPRTDLKSYSSVIDRKVPQSTTISDQKMIEAMTLALGVDFPTELKKVIGQFDEPCERLTSRGKFCGHGDLKTTGDPFEYGGTKCRQKCLTAPLCPSWIERVLTTIPSAVVYNIAGAPGAATRQVIQPVSGAQLVISYTELRLLAHSAGFDETYVNHKEVILTARSMLDKNIWLISTSTTGQQIVTLAQLIETICNQLSQWSSEPAPSSSPLDIAMYLSTTGRTLSEVSTITHLDSNLNPMDVGMIGLSGKGFTEFMLSQAGDCDCYVNTVVDQLRIPTLVRRK